LTVGLEAIDIPVQRDQEEKIACREQEIGQSVSRAGHDQLRRCDHPEGTDEEQKER
jgi:hypothetical protein